MFNLTSKKCIICQKSGDLISTENGRRTIINAAAIRKDDVHLRLQSASLDANFRYHMDNTCYKRYTHKKTVNKMKVCKTACHFCYF